MVADAKQLVKVKVVRIVKYETAAFYFSGRLPYTLAEKERERQTSPSLAYFSAKSHCSRRGMAASCALCRRASRCHC